MRKLPKTRDYKSLLGTGIKAVLVVEGLFLIGTYALWSRMNSSRDFRFKVHNYCPPILESYYFMGEKLGNLPTRQLDYKAWGISQDK
ncbi:protein CEBPZOS-like [Babylonia areolata]|uniref:protein CEBPZOS-like n=1 Tax=Babylonia areolata TaxID=304850 RepID=UPI003FD27750